MKVYTSLQPSQHNTNEPIALTIGTFDGIHLGHKEILSKISQQKSCVVTFSTPPSDFFQKQNRGLILTVEHRLFLLEKLGIDIVYLLDFTPTLAETPAENFLLNLYQALPFTHLYLGEDASFGYKRGGSPSVLQALSEKMRFELYYFPKKNINNQIVSSTLIRKHIEQAFFLEVKALLGRPYSIYSHLQAASDNKMHLSFNLSLDNLIFPKSGTWQCETIIEEKSFPSTAMSTTSNGKTLLELKFPNNIPYLNKKRVEVIFHS